MPFCTFDLFWGNSYEGVSIKLIMTLINKRPVTVVWLYIYCHVITHVNFLYLRGACWQSYLMYCLHQADSSASRIRCSPCNSLKHIYQTDVKFSKKGLNCMLNECNLRLYINWKIHFSWKFNTFPRVDLEGRGGAELECVPSKIWQALVK